MLILCIQIWSCLQLNKTSLLLLVASRVGTGGKHYEKYFFPGNKL